MEQLSVCTQVLLQPHGGPPIPGRRHVSHEAFPDSDLLGVLTESDVGNVAEGHAAAFSYALKPGSNSLYLGHSTFLVDSPILATPELHHQVIVRQIIAAEVHEHRTPPLGHT